MNRHTENSHRRYEKFGREDGGNEMTNDLIPVEYSYILQDIILRIRSSQYKALQAVNRELISLYWDIGHIIKERQKGDTWGKRIVEKLAYDLQGEFPGIKGFSVSNLWRMKLFYESYEGSSKLAPLVREIGWTHNIIIMEKCKDDLMREFYIRMILKFGWTKNVLIHQIENQTYEKTMIGQTNFEVTLPDEIKKQAKLAVKDEYTFDFLELGDEHNERQLETAILAKVEPFLLEMGGLFSFIGSQYRLVIDDSEFFIDLLLYHRQLKCLVALELKVGKFLPEYVGKMQFYLAALDEKVRMSDENPSIGIIMCKSKNKTIVEYALKQSRKPIGVAEYQIVSTVPKEYFGLLPAPDQIELLLDVVE